MNKETLQIFYEFVGEFEEILSQEYNQTPLHEQRFTYPQFCIIKFYQIIN